MSEIGTKIDLAKAYMDMGDPEGARSILTEVLTEGTKEQKGEARRLIKQLPKPQTATIRQMGQTELDIERLNRYTRELAEGYGMQATLSCDGDDISVEVIKQGIKRTRSAKFSNMLQAEAFIAQTIKAMSAAGAPR
jgi:FimV-like protein